MQPLRPSACSRRRAVRAATRVPQSFSSSNLSWGEVLRQPPNDRGLRCLSCLGEVFLGQPERGFMATVLKDFWRATTLRTVLSWIFSKCPISHELWPSEWRVCINFRVSWDSSAFFPILDDTQIKFSCNGYREQGWQVDVRLPKVEWYPAPFCVSIGILHRMSKRMFPWPNV